MPPLLPPPTPSGTRTPWWLWLVLLVGLCALESGVMRKDDWGRTPRNQTWNSSPGSWTFMWVPEDSMATFVIGGLGLLWIFLIFSTSTALWIYAAFFALAMAAFITECSNSERWPSAYVGLGKAEEWGRLILGGAVMGAIWLLLTGLLTDLLGVTYVITSPIDIPWLRLPLMSVAVSIGFLGFLAPVIEEKVFRQVLAPTIAESAGILPGVAISGVLFGLAHYVFGGSFALAVSATGFGVVLAYFVLRHQGAAFAYAAHITYNMLVIIISYLVWAV